MGRKSKMKTLEELKIMVEDRTLDSDETYDQVMEAATRAEQNGEDMDEWEDTIRRASHYLISNDLYEFEDYRD